MVQPWTWVTQLPPTMRTWKKEREGEVHCMAMCLGEKEQREINTFYFYSSRRNLPSAELLHHIDTVWLFRKQKQCRSVMQCARSCSWCFLLRVHFKVNCNPHASAFWSTRSIYLPDSWTVVWGDFKESLRNWKTGKGGKKRSSSVWEFPGEIAVQKAS